MIRRWLVLSVVLAACGGRTIVDLSSSPSVGGDGDGDGDGDTAGMGGGSSGAGGMSISGQGAVGGGGVSGGAAIGGFGGLPFSGGIGGSGAIGGSGGLGGFDLEVCLGAESEVDYSCPQAVGPFEGACAPKYDCCRRSSNAKESAYLGLNDSQAFEYRISQALVLNHPLSMSLPIMKMSAAARATQCGGEQCRLIRMTKPRADGALVSANGYLQAGIGRYNCDGTYSFYDDLVAPIREEVGLYRSDRWETRPADTLYQPHISGESGIQVWWGDDPSKELSCIPYFLSGTQTIDWEECSSGFELIRLHMDGSYNDDCLGFWNGASWETSNRFQTFVPLADNNLDIIDSIGQTYCQMLSFSVLAPEERDVDCLATPRCQPNDQGCLYVKLPDSLCPVDEYERSLFRCHLGARGNPNDEDEYPTNLPCTVEAPMTALDPDANPFVSTGQCCDPLGAGTDGLPACNAFRMVYEFAASAVEITTEAKSEFPPICSF